MTRPNLHLVQPTDYAPRVLERSDSHIDLYRTLEEEERIHRVYRDVRRDLRIMRLQAFVKWGAIITAFAAIMYFAFQMGRSGL